MKQELTQVIEQLANDKMFAISVTSIDDTGLELRIITHATNEILIQKYGSAVNFFETLFKNGVKKIKVYPKKQNGTVPATGKINYKPATMPPFEVEFEPKQNVENQPMQPVQQTMPERIVHQAVPMNAPTGLSGSDMYKIYDYDKVVRDLERIKAERNLLRDEKIRLERQLFEQETLGVKSLEKTKAQAEMLNSPVASTLIQLLAQKLVPVAGETIGLGQGLSQIKQVFVQLDDSFLQELYKIGELMQNNEFDTKLTELVTQFSNPS